MDPRSQQPQADNNPDAEQFVSGQEVSLNQPAPTAAYSPPQDMNAGQAMPLQPQSSPQQDYYQQPTSPQEQSPAPQQPQEYAQAPTEQYQQYEAPLQPVENPYDVRQFAAQPIPPIPQTPQPAVQPVAGTPAQPQPGVAPAHTNPNSTQNMLQIAEIRDGIVIMNDGSYRSVVMIKSINFDLMSTQEQEAVESGYQSFLNSLYFPIQIFIRSQKVDLQPYIDKLDKIRSEHDNMLLALLMDDYIGYIDALAQQTNIMDKKFYIVIPFFPVLDVQKALTQSKNFISGIAAMFNSKEQHVVINEADLENAKTELRNRVQAVLAGLMQCGIQGLPLDTQELIELYYDTYNPDTATRQQLKNFNNLTADVITKGEGTATQPHLQRELG